MVMAEWRKNAHFIGKWHIYAVQRRLLTPLSGTVLATTRMCV